MSERLSASAGMDEARPRKSSLSLRVRLDVYYLYCRLLYPFYRRLRVGNLFLVIDSPDIMPPLSSSEKLIFGELREKSVLDIGTGCGIIALTAKNMGARYVLGVDIRPAAIENARKNAETNFGNTSGLDFQCGDLYDGIASKFDIIASNPPYFVSLPSRTDDYKYCGGDILERMVREGKHYLTSAGEIRILHPAYSRNYMSDLAERFGYSLDVLDHVPRTGNWMLRFILGHTVRSKLMIYILRLRRADVMG
jgi:release factor glutamine methyltransferase